MCVFVFITATIYHFKTRHMAHSEKSIKVPQIYCPATIKEVQWKLEIMCNKLSSQH